MKDSLRSLYRWSLVWGYDPRKTIQVFKGLPSYFSDLWQLKKQRKPGESGFPFGRLYPCFDEKSTDRSPRDHYFYQDLIVAQRIFLNRPSFHVDVGSRVDGFVAHVASFRTIEVLDIRPSPDVIPNVNFRRLDLMAPLPQEFVGFCDSLSCLHVLEHVGLGRYGDTLDYDGYLLGFDNLTRMVRQGGKLYLSVPIGPQRIEFNAHRVFGVNRLIELFSGRYRIDVFSFVDDLGHFHPDMPINSRDAENNYGCRYGCGIFEMTKL